MQTHGWVRYLLSLHASDQARDGQRRAVDPGHAQAFQDHLTDLRVGTVGKEAAQLHQKPEVKFLDRGAVRFL